MGDEVASRTRRMRSPEDFPGSAVLWDYLGAVIGCTANEVSMQNPDIVPTFHSHSLFHSLTHSLAYSLTPSFSPSTPRSHSLALSFARSLIHSLTHWSTVLTYSLPSSLTKPFRPSTSQRLTCSIAHSHAHSHTNGLGLLDYLLPSLISSFTYLLTPSFLVPSCVLPPSIADLLTTARIFYLIASHLLLCSHFDSLH